ncbi:hypothetical protein A2U01_0000646, partial [Trifolium medium]|nr:hypothetical protein [Trifolium medium]
DFCFDVPLMIVVLCCVLQNSSFMVRVLQISIRVDLLKMKFIYVEKDNTSMHTTKKGTDKHTTFLVESMEGIPKTQEQAKPATTRAKHATRPEPMVPATAKTIVDTPMTDTDDATSATTAATTTDNAILETPSGSCNMRDTQYRELSLVVQKDMQIIRKSWADMEEQEQPFTTYVSKQKKKNVKKTRRRSAGQPYHIRSKDDPPHLSL